MTPFDVEIVNGQLKTVKNDDRLSDNYKTAGLVFSTVAGRYSIGAVNNFEEGDRQKDLMNPR
jgi:hypothetical protein